MVCTFALFGVMRVLFWCIRASGWRRNISPQMSSSADNALLTSLWCRYQEFRRIYRVESVDLRVFMGWISVEQKY